MLQAVDRRVRVAPAAEEELDLLDFREQHRVEPADSLVLPEPVAGPAPMGALGGRPLSVLC